MVVCMHDYIIRNNNSTSLAKNAVPRAVPVTLCHKKEREMHQYTCIPLHIKLLYRAVQWLSLVNAIMTLRNPSNAQQGYRRYRSMHSEPWNGWRWCVSFALGYTQICKLWKTEYIAVCILRKVSLLRGASFSWKCGFLCYVIQWQWTA